MKFHRIEHISFFDHGTFFQVSLTEIPAFFHIVPKIIDGEQFSSSRFGIDVWRDLNSGQFTALTDVDVLGVERTFYYIASDGRKSWVEAELSSNFYQEIFTACEQAEQTMRPRYGPPKIPVNETISRKIASRTRHHKKLGPTR